MPDTTTPTTARILSLGRQSTDKPNGFKSFGRTITGKKIVGRLYMQFSNLLLTAAMLLLYTFNGVPLNVWNFVAAASTLFLFGMTLVVAARTFRWATRFKAAFAWFFNGPIGGGVVAIVAYLLLQGGSVSFGSTSSDGVPLFFQQFLVASCYLLLFTALLFTTRMPAWLAQAKIEEASAPASAAPESRTRPDVHSATA